MELYLFSYLLIGITFTVSVRLYLKTKIALGNLLFGVFFWPVLLLVFLFFFLIDYKL